MLPRGQFADETGLLGGLDTRLLPRLLAEDPVDLVLELLQLSLGLLDSHQLADQAGTFGVTRGEQTLLQVAVLLLDLGAGRLDGLAGGPKVVQVELLQGCGVFFCLLVGLLLLFCRVQGRPGGASAGFQGSCQIALVQLVLTQRSPALAVGRRFLLQLLDPVFVLLGQARSGLVFAA